MHKKVLLVLLVALCFPVMIFAETVLLKSGKTVEGKLVEKTDKFITIDFEGVSLTYYNDEIESINGQALVAAPLTKEPNLPLQVEQTSQNFSQAVVPLENKQAAVDTFSVLSKINNYIAPPYPTSKYSKKEGYDYRIDNGMPVPPTFVEVFVFDLWANLKGDSSDDLGNPNDISEQMVRSGLESYKKLEWRHIRGWRPWTHWNFVNSLSNDEFNVLVQETTAYMHKNGVSELAKTCLLDKKNLDEDIRKMQIGILSRNNNLTPEQLDKLKKLTPEQMNKMMKTTMLIQMIVLAFVLLTFVFSAICLQRVANKLNQGPAWWAWVPIASTILTVKTAGLEGIWALMLLAYFIPKIGVPCVIVFSAYLWYRIAFALNKPLWVRVLIVIPVMNLIAMGYLAFSED